MTLEQEATDRYEAERTRLDRARRPRLALVLTAHDLERLGHEYLAEIGATSDLRQQLQLSSFIHWVQQRQRRL